MKCKICGSESGSYPLCRAASAMPNGKLVSHGIHEMRKLALCRFPLPL